MALVGGLLALGCVAFEHGMQASAVAGRPLSTTTPEGARRLALESELDATVDDWLRRNGKPDYLYVASRSRVYLFYLEPDRAAMFERDLATSEVVDLGRTPGSLLRLLPEAEAKRIVARRRAATRSARARASRPARREAAPGPAAIAPNGTYFGSFDVARVADRMREQRSAADPGVRHWRKSQLANGDQRWWSEVGGARYEVRPDAVAVATTLAAGSRGVTRVARAGVLRINTAVFAVKGEAVTQTVLPFLRSVAADASGRTAIARRVEGRTVRVQRLPAQGLLVYSIHP